MDGTGGGLWWCGDAAGQWLVWGRAGGRWAGGSMAGLSRRVWWFFSAGRFGGGLPFLGWLLWWCTCSVGMRCGLFGWRVWWRARAVLTWRAGEGGGLILPALAKSAPTLPSPPRHHGTARCAACGCVGRNAGRFCSSLHRWPACSFFRVTPHSGAGAHGIARTRGEPFRQSLLAACGGRLTPCSGAERSNVTPTWQTKRSNANPNRQSEAAPPYKPTISVPQRAEDRVPLPGHRARQHHPHERICCTSACGHVRWRTDPPGGWPYGGWA